MFFSRNIRHVSEMPAMSAGCGTDARRLADNIYVTDRQPVIPETLQPSVY